MKLPVDEFIEARYRKRLGGNPRGHDPRRPEASAGKPLNADRDAEVSAISPFDSRLLVHGGPMCVGSTGYSAAGSPAKLNCSVDDVLLVCNNRVPAVLHALLTGLRAVRLRQ